jgi:hypothetical protein
MPTNQNLRAGDRDREQVVDVLGEHLAAGRMDIGKFKDRICSAYAAVTFADLDLLVVDLPRCKGGIIPIRILVPACSPGRRADRVLASAGRGPC